MDKQYNDLIKKFENLAAELEVYEYHYRILHNPIISDEEFDIKMHELETMEKINPEFVSLISINLKKIGDDSAKGFQSHSHATPMGSITNAYSDAEVIDF